MKSDLDSALPAPIAQAGQDAVAPNGGAKHSPAYIAKATKAAVDFESFFISHMLHDMRATTRELASEDSIFKDPVNSDMLDMADNMMAGSIAGQRAFGIADAILRQLLPEQFNKPK
jgi:flagellar protein FlgJ